MATTKLGLIFEIAAHPEKAIEALREFDAADKESMDSVTEHMRKTKIATQELSSFIGSHLIFSVDEFTRLGRDAMEAAKSAVEFGVQVYDPSQAMGIGAKQISRPMVAFKETGADMTALLTLNDALISTKTSMQAFTGEQQVAVQFQQKFGQAMGANIAQAIVYGESIGKAMDRALKATLTSIASQAMVRAIFETAVGFAELFVDPAAAAAAFESAALFAAVGGSAAVIGAAIPGGARDAGGRRTGPRYSVAETNEGRREGGYGGGGSLVPAKAYQAPSGGGNLTVAIMGDEEAGNWLATTLNRAVTQQGVQLVATGSQRGAPVGH